MKIYEYTKQNALWGKIALSLTFAAAVVSCNNVGDNEFKIAGTAEGVKDGTEIYMKRQDSLGIKNVDTAKVTNGKFEFEGNVTDPSIHFLQVKDIQGGFPFVLENGEIKLTVNKDTITKSKIGGTLSNDKLMAYSLEYEKINKKMRAYQEANMAKWQEAAKSNDTVTRNALIKGNKVYEEEFQALMKNEIEKSPKSYLSLLFVTQMINQPDVDAAKVKKYFESLDPALQNTMEGKKAKKAIDALSKTSVGSIAPDFSAPNTEGKMVSLKESLGKVTLVDFWASWCGPCREENPNVVALYNEFHAKGLNIVGVSFDKPGDDAKWKEAIAKDGLVWTQVSNLKHWEDPIVKLYSINSIPSTYLLDANGKIIAKDLRGAELKAKVASLLGS